MKLIKNSLKNAILRLFPGAFRKRVGVKGNPGVTKEVMHATGTSAQDLIDYMIRGKKFSPQERELLAKKISKISKDLDADIMITSFGGAPTEKTQLKQFLDQLEDVALAQHANIVRREGIDNRMPFTIVYEGDPDRTGTLSYLRKSLFEKIPVIEGVLKSKPLHIEDKTINPLYSLPHEVGHHIVAKKYPTLSALNQLLYYDAGQLSRKSPSGILARGLVSIPNAIEEAMASYIGNKALLYENGQLMVSPGTSRRIKLLELLGLYQHSTAG